MQEKEILKYISGEANEEEQKAVINWIRESIDNQKQYNLLKANYVANTLNASEKVDINKEYQNFSNKRTKKRKHYYSAIIAAVIIPFFLWQIYDTFPENRIETDSNLISEHQTIEITTKQGDRKRVILPDGSVIILNSESSLTYPTEFSDSTRNVVLIGEAFFDVKKDPKRPLIVKTEHLDIKVLGTSFNVKSYPEDENIETTLVTGKVEVIQQTNENLVVLQPSQRAVFEKAKKNLKVDKVEPNSIIAWKQGKLIFDQTPLKQVVLDLNRKYNKEFVIESDTLFRYKYTGTFDNLSLEEVLKLLKVSSPINYELKNDKVMLKIE
ncbi:FecR family protein [Aquimarina sp. 2201CG5-10]|uniref:FecR family protein n=1 Tax=Aquimarina callyspongiae TaxID=3098150 RepID=UPI002AB4A145|nr:FecR domain-containing protein [Aquimarina sp. 2201CG5-10]MDY8135801.1 DUF4974 domain-containing protein [Aquimarina sp. 2201CG5-10]